MTACDACLRRTHLVALLAGHVERARHDGGRLPELLSLPDDRLLAAIAGRRRGPIEAQLESFDATAARSACAAVGVTAVCRHAEVYPSQLRHADDAPAVLHVAGRLARFEALARADASLWAVAIVGARRATPYGLEVAHALGRELAVAGVTVISGMALGIDSAAHAGALAGGGTTHAVLAGAPEVAYPSSKRRLHAALVADHAVISEMPPGYAPFRWNFPARNRIIAALASMTVVVEATERSGSLITADIATDLGRQIGAVPGPVGSTRSSGTNALLHDGAHVVRGAHDVLDLALSAGWSVPRLAATVRERDEARLPRELRRVLELVDAGRDTPGALAAVHGDVAAATVALTELELLGHLRRGPDGRYGRAL